MCLEVPCPSPSVECILWSTAVVNVPVLFAMVSIAPSIASYIGSCLGHIGRLDKWTDKSPLASKPGESNGNPLQYSCLENPIDGGAWWAAVPYGVLKSQTWLGDFTFTFHSHALEKEMAPHSSVLAWRIPGTAEPGGLQSMGSHRVGHDWSDLAAAAASKPWWSALGG